MESCLPHLVAVDAQPNDLLRVDGRFQLRGACGEVGGERQERVLAPSESTVGTETQGGFSGAVESGEEQTAVVGQERGLCERRGGIGSFAHGEQALPAEGGELSGVDIALPHAGAVVEQAVECDFGEHAVGLRALHAHGALSGGELGRVGDSHTVGFPHAVDFHARSGTREVEAQAAGRPLAGRGAHELLCVPSRSGAACPSDGVAGFAVHAQFDLIGALRRAIGGLHHHGGLSRKVGGESALFALLHDEGRCATFAQTDTAACAHRDAFDFRQVGVGRKGVDVVNQSALLVDGEAVETAFHLDRGHTVAPVVFRAQIDLSVKIADIETRDNTVRRYVAGFCVVVQARGQSAGSEKQHGGARKRRELV